MLRDTKTILFVLTTLNLFSSGNTKTSNQGQWELLKRNLGISAMHMQLLSTGKLVIYDRTDAGPSNISLPFNNCLHLSKRKECTAHSVEFDPLDLQVRPLTITSETWCSSGSLLSNGTLIQTGGYGEGERAVRYFSSCKNCDWAEHSQGLVARRWYSSNCILPDDRVIVVGGRHEFNYEFVPKHSHSDYRAIDLPFLAQTSDNWENNLYPFVHLSTDGNLFIFANTKAILLDYINNKVLRSYPEMPGGVSRNYPSTGSSVLLPLVPVYENGVVRAEVMICGGSEASSIVSARTRTFLPASSSCGHLVITEESPVWEMEEMPMGRVMGDMVLLPTGDVLIINGAGKGTAGWWNAREPVLSPVLYKTGIIENVGREFQVMSATTIPRLYHSTAHLVPDGRVIVGGSNPNIRYEFTGVVFPTELSLEAFSPPYLGSAESRPEIMAIEEGDSFRYGQKKSISIVVKSKLQDGVHVTMMSSAFTTHSFAMNQRLLVLEIERLGDGEGGTLMVEVLAPESAVLAPPGYYMLFVVHEGIPSPGKWVNVRQ